MEDQLHPFFKWLHGIVLLGLVILGFAKWASEGAKSNSSRPPDSKPDKETFEKSPVPELRLIRPTGEQVARVGQYWPGSFGELPDEPAKYFLSFDHEGTELMGLKVQFVDIPADRRQERVQAYRAILAASLAAYLELDHQGVMCPVVYFKENKEPHGLAEVGFALFVGPAAANVDSADSKDERIYDGPLGRGATPMVMDMIAVISETGNRLSAPLPPIIGLDLSTRKQLGVVVIDFLIESHNAFVIRPDVDPALVPWRFLTQGGIAEMPHLPIDPGSNEGI